VTVNLDVTPLKWDQMISNVPAGIGVTSFTPFPEEGINLMIQELSNLCLAGEIDNTTNNRIDGWLRLGGMAAPVILEITGNCGDGLQGKRILFERPLSPGCLSTEEQLSGLAFHQVGAAGNISWTSNAGSGQGMLLIEWYSQNGHMRIDWPEIAVQFREPHVASAPVSVVNPLDFSSIPPARWTWSPSLMTQVNETASSHESTIHAGDPWNTDIDNLYQFLDELGDGSCDMPIISQLESPPSPDLTGQMRPAEIQEALRDLVAQLARLGISVNICPHFSAERALRWLVEEVIYEEQVHPRMVCHGYVSFYMTSDRCPDCSLEFGRDADMSSDE